MWNFAHFLILDTYTKILKMNDYHPNNIVCVNFGIYIFRFMLMIIAPNSRARMGERDVEQRDEVEYGRI